MKARFSASLLAVVLGITTLLAQAPSVQLKIKEKSGFLGMGGPRIIKLELSNKAAKPIDSDNVNDGQYYYFLCTPAADWKIDEDFVKDDLAQLTIYQNEQRFQIGWKGEITANGEGATTIMLGFPKSFKLNQLFLFQIKIDDAQNQAEFSVPPEFWPGYSIITTGMKKGNELLASNQFRQAIYVFETLLLNTDLQIFPQFDELKSKRTTSYEGLLNQRWSTFNALLTNEQMELKDRIAQIDGSKPSFQFFVDSLPRPAWNIGSLDPAIAPIIGKARNAITTSNLVRDSLQKILDDRNTRWIIEGSATGKNGYLFQAMMEALAYGFSSLNFADTSAAELKLRLPEDQTAKLTKYNIVESYATFLRMCNERYQTHLPIFPIDFLPNLRKDTAAFAQPFYAMLKAVNDYFYGNLSSAKDEVFRVFRSCYEPELNARFDNMRVQILIREQRIPAEALRMIDEADQLDAKGDRPSALDKYRQVTIIAPNFAYGFYALGKYFVRSGEPIRAITFFQKAYQIDTLYLNAYRDCFNLYLKQSNFKPMIDVLSIALQYGNDYWETNYRLGASYLGDNDPGRAIQSFTKALAWNPKSYDTNIQLGLAHQNVKDFQKAREYFNRAIDLDPTRQEAVNYLSKLNDLQRSVR
ncbi:MAG: tetratricopeptide repeat protein [Ignavibacteriales bacterium]|nr:tetratricopeptide repeat protein [Ignavibacteriales bacterium]